MGRLTTLETKLGDLYKNAPALPKNAKQTIVEWWPIVSLVLGLIQVVAAYALWNAYRASERIVSYVNEFTRLYGETVTYSAFDKIVIYAGIVTLAVSGVIMIAAYSPLKARAKRGWDLLFLGLMVGVVYAVLSIFMDMRGIGTFIMNLVGVAIGLYFLYQIRDAYTTKS